VQRTDGTCIFRVPYQMVGIHCTLGSPHGPWRPSPASWKTESEVSYRAATRDAAAGLRPNRRAISGKELAVSCNRRLRCRTRDTSPQLRSAAHSAPKPSARGTQYSTCAFTPPGVTQFRHTFEVRQTGSSSAMLIVNGTLRGATCAMQNWMLHSVHMFRSRYFCRA
jgi:hypothetical protein